jgi:hypothetical protein
MPNEIQTKSRNGIQTRNPNDAQPQDIQNKARGLLNNLVSSVQTLVSDITALEVNTMVVDRINASKFNAWEAYQEIYSIHDPDYFEAKGVLKLNNYVSVIKVYSTKLKENIFTFFLRKVQIFIIRKTIG